MARIRTIKPEFFTSEDIVRLTPLARLFYVSLWCEADREGRLDWRVGTLKMRYFPADNCDIQDLANELISSGLIELYEVDGKQYAEIPSFKNHQIINNRESDSTRPPRVKHASPRVLGEGKEGKERKGRNLCVEPQSDSTPIVVSIPLVDGTEHSIHESSLAEWKAAYPGVDVVQQLHAMRAWCNANPAKRKTPKGVGSFVVRWLGGAQDKAGAHGVANSQRPRGLVL